MLPKHNRVGVRLLRSLPELEEKLGARLHAATLTAFPEMKRP